MKTLTCRIAARPYDAALKFCNERRKGVVGMRPWKKLPAGSPSNFRECPCGKAIPRLLVFKGTWIIQPPQIVNAMAVYDTGEALPPLVKLFVDDFDRVGVRAQIKAKRPFVEVLPLRGLKAPRKKARKAR